MTVGYFPPFCEILSDGSRTFSTFFPKFVRITVGHFPPFLQILSEWLWDVFLLFMKTCQYNDLTFFHKKEENVLPSFWQVFQKRRKMSHCHSDKFSKKGGKCPTVILTSFQKKKENVRMSFWHVFTKRRKMSSCHSDRFSKKGGKCLTVILTSFHKKEENVFPSFWHAF